MAATEKGALSLQIVSALARQRTSRAFPPALELLREGLRAEGALLAFLRPWLEGRRAALWDAGSIARPIRRLEAASVLASLDAPATYACEDLPASLRPLCFGASSFVVVPLVVEKEQLGSVGLFFDTPEGAAPLDHLAVAAKPLSLALSRINAIEKLRVSQRDYRRLVEGVSSVILRLDARGEIRFVNDYGQRFFGFEQGELLGKNVIGTIVEPMEDAEGNMSRLMADVQQRPQRYLHSEMMHRKKDGSCAWVRWSNKAILGEHGELREILSVGTDITERKELEEELRELATTDSLTHAFNRRKLLSELTRELARAARHQRPLCMLMIDLDHFKEVNDRYGHEMGDAVLVHAVEHFRHALRDQDLVGRLGGEEFALVLPETALEAAVSVAKRLQRFEDTAPAPAPYTFSVGVAQWRDGESVGELLRRADDALYRAKDTGRDRVVAGE